MFVAFFSVIDSDAYFGSLEVCPTRVRQMFFLRYELSYSMSQSPLLCSAMGFKVASSSPRAAEGSLRWR